MAGTQRTAQSSLWWCHCPVTGLSWSHLRLGPEAASDYGGIVSQTWWEVNSVSGEMHWGRDCLLHVSASALAHSAHPRVVLLGWLEQRDSFSYTKSIW